MVAPKNRLTTDALREIRHTFSRFLSILVLAALAVAFLSGLRATAPDMKFTADNYYDRTHLMDGCVLSTLGLTREDLDALAASPGVEDAEGAWSVDATAVDCIVSVRSMPERLNLLEVKQGRLPQSADECVTERLLLTELGLEVGDTLELLMDEDNEGDLIRTSYTIVGVVSCPLYVGPDRGASSLGGGSVDAFVFIPSENFTYDYYTAAYFTGAGLAGLNSYSDEYDDRADALIDSLDGLAEERAQLRYDSLIGDAQAELDDARKELSDARDEADQELADAKQELDDARKELDDGWADYHDGQDTLERELADARRELADAQVKLTDAQAELDDGRIQYEDGLAEYESGLADYESGLKEYQDALAQFQEGKAEYEDGLAQFEEAKAKYEDGLAEYEQGRADYEDGLASFSSGQQQYQSGLKRYQESVALFEQQKAEGEKQLQAAIAQLQAALGNGLITQEQFDAQVAAMQAQAEQQLAAAQAQLDAAQAQLDKAWKELDKGATQLGAAANQLSDAKDELDRGKRELDRVEAELDDAKRELDEGQAELDDAKAELDDAARELDDAKRELDDAAQEIADAEQEIADGWRDYRTGQVDLAQAETDGRQELADALIELNDGEREYADGLKEYEDGKAEAEEKIADAQQKLDDAQDELDDVEDCEWYVLGRNTNAGFVSFSQDTERVSNLATIFPVIFFLVAALACLTTMTRMVEEQRTQIGALKAMGFSRLSISKKYIGYAFSASLIGGILGLAIGCTLIPAVIANAFNIMYAMPPLEFREQTALCVLSVLAAVACTTGAALWACLSTLMATPASLMRPRAPKAGKRVFLERVRPIWRRLSFTWKVTMRNLFRYQRRFWMTVIGIGGCTALIVTGFGLHESIFAILDKQFDEIFLYDASVGLDKDAAPEDRAAVEDYLAGSPYLDRTLTGHQALLDVSNGGMAYDAYLRTISDLDTYRRFVDLRHRTDSAPVSLPDDGVIITEKLAELLEADVGDAITLDGDKRVEAVVADIVENYAYHYVYLSEACYQALFGTAPEDNVILLAYREDTSAAQSDAVSAELMALDAVTSYSYIATLRDSFTNSMVAIDYAVVIIITAAAALAFVVLYNLTNINITERTRELATLKVLGFFDKETTAYVYRENVFLTIFGIVLGLVLGRLLHAWLVLTVEVDLVMFGRTAPPYAYVLAAALTVAFSVMVNIAAHFKLKKVDMVESLKTVE